MGAEGSPPARVGLDRRSVVRVRRTLRFVSSYLCGWQLVGCRGAGPTGSGGCPSRRSVYLGVSLRAD